MVSLTKINKETVLAILVFHLEKCEVSLFLLAPLGLWTVSHLISLCCLPLRNSVCSAVSTSLRRMTQSDDSREYNININTGL